MAPILSLMDSAEYGEIQLEHQGLSLVRRHEIIFSFSRKSLAPPQFDEWQLRETLLDVLKLHAKFSLAQDRDLTVHKEKDLRRMTKCEDAVATAALRLWGTEEKTSATSALIQKKLDRLELRVGTTRLICRTAIGGGPPFEEMEKEWEAEFGTSRGGYAKRRPGERPDTLRWRGIPSRWLAEPKVSAEASVLVTHSIFAQFGTIRRMEILNSEDVSEGASISDIAARLRAAREGSSVNPMARLHCEVIVQYEEYEAFAAAMRVFVGRSLKKAGTPLLANYTIERDTSNFFDEKNVRLRKYAREQEESERRRLEEADQRRKEMAAKKAELLRLEEERKAAEERERELREEEERLQREERERQEEEERLRREEELRIQEAREAEERRIAEEERLEREAAEAKRQEEALVQRQQEEERRLRVELHARAEEIQQRLRRKQEEEAKRREEDEWREQERRLRARVEERLQYTRRNEDNGGSRGRGRGRRSEERSDGEREEDWRRSRDDRRRRDEGEGGRALGGRERAGERDTDPYRRASYRDTDYRRPASREEERDNERRRSVGRDDTRRGPEPRERAVSIGRDDYGGRGRVERWGEGSREEVFEETEAHRRGPEGRDREGNDRDKGREFREKSHGQPRDESGCEEIEAKQRRGLYVGERGGEELRRQGNARRERSYAVQDQTQKEESLEIEAARDDTEREGEGGHVAKKRKGEGAWSEREEESERWEEERGGNDEEGVVKGRDMNDMVSSRRGGMEDKELSRSWISNGREGEEEARVEPSSRRLRSIVVACR
eukprot:TRINITY_DN4875_c0_g1_i1.p1 TRINITY_DN4875_c0_g1~~TRINITY_DN4875_c0_g1_i1.p1  ORF type:complete len:787 (+),score=218.51 TRINITY_DN4875_c0_g1_i1:432-2792(+)